LSQVHGLAEHFDLRSESLDEEPHRSIVIHRTSTSCIPSPTLTEALLALKKNGGSVLNLGSLRKVVPERMPNNALLLDAVGGYDREGLQAIVSPWMRGLSFKLDWVVGFSSSSPAPHSISN
jgi:transcriptional repressor NF-X1